MSGCGIVLKAGQYFTYCGETDMGQTMPALCTNCGGAYLIDDEDHKVQRDLQPIIGRPDTSIKLKNNEALAMAVPGQILNLRSRVEPDDKALPARTCVTCKHHEIQAYGDLCREMIYPITGDYAACYDVRIGSVINYIPVSGKDKACGLDGNLWEPKQQ